MSSVFLRDGMMPMSFFELVLGSCQRLAGDDVAMLPFSFLVLGEALFKSSVLLFAVVD